MTTTATTKPKRTRRFAREPLSAAPAGKPVQPDPSQTGLAAFAASPQAEGKTSRVLALLQRPDGATLDELVAATSWLPHTTRAALTGLKKKGYAVTSEKVEGQRQYRIVDGAV